MESRHGASVSHVDLSRHLGSFCLVCPLQDGSLQCPSCKTIYGEKTGTQPWGKMEVFRFQMSLPGHEDCGTILIVYNIPHGIQVWGLARVTIPEHPSSCPALSQHLYPVWGQDSPAGGLWSDGSLSFTSLSERELPIGEVAGQKTKPKT